MSSVAALFLLGVTACGSGGIEATTEALELPTPAIVEALFDAPDDVIRLDIEMEPSEIALMMSDLEVQVALPAEERDYEYFDCAVRFQGTTFEHVGIRHKGNSSLVQPYLDGRTKLHYKLDFDKFDDDYPETEDRTFLGMDKVNLANGFRDPTLMRDILSVGLLREFGARAPRARSCAVYFNDEFRGLYAVIEQVDKTFLRDRFGDDSGNLYKPGGGGEGGALTRFVQEQLEKKTNKKAGWGDVEEFIEELNDPDVDIETIFDVDSFIPWLAVSVAICNLDSYLARPHNYYLYNNPATGLFHFISWDHNVCYGTNTVDGFDHTNVHTYPVDVPSIPGTPLVERVLAVAEYRQRYEALIDQLARHPMGSVRAVTLHAAMRPWARMERFPFSVMYDSSDFDRNLDELVAVPAFKPNTPGLLDFIEKRRAFLLTR